MYAIPTYTANIGGINTSTVIEEIQKSNIRYASRTRNLKYKFDSSYHPDISDNFLGVYDLLKERFNSIYDEKKETKRHIDILIDELKSEHIQYNIQLKNYEYEKLLKSAIENTLISYAFRKYEEENENLREIKIDSNFDTFIIIELIETLNIEISTLVRNKELFEKTMLEFLDKNTISGKWGSLYVRGNKIFMLINPYKDKIVKEINSGIHVENIGLDLIE